MGNNDTLKQLFDTFQPNMADGENFMDALTEHLDAVEYIKQQQEKQLRRYRYAVIAALVLGLICGGTLLAFILMMTDAAPLFTFDTRIVPLVMLQEHSRTLVLIGIAAFMVCGIVALAGNVVPLLVDDKQRHITN